MNLGVAQLVARYLGVVEAAGSSPVTQTRNRESKDSRFSFLFFLKLQAGLFSPFFRGEQTRFSFISQVRNALQADRKPLVAYPSRYLHAPRQKIRCLRIHRNAPCY